MDLHHSTGTGGLRCNLPSSEVAQYLKAISSHLSLHSESSASIYQRSACPPLSARRILSSVSKMLRIFGETNPPDLLTFVSFEFDKADIEACLRMQAEAQGDLIFSWPVHLLPWRSIGLRMYLEFNDSHRAPGAQVLQLGIELESYIAHELMPSALIPSRYEGMYTILARALPHMGTDRQVDIACSSHADDYSGGYWLIERPYEVDESCWTHSALQEGAPLCFFIAIWLKGAEGHDINVLGEVLGDI